MFATLATCHAGALTARVTIRPGASTRSPCSRPVATSYRREFTLLRLPAARTGSQLAGYSGRRSQRTNLASNLRGRLVVKADGASRSIEAASVNLRNPQPLRLLLVPAAALAVLGQVIDGKGIMLASYWCARYFLPAAISLYVAKDARKRWDSMTASVVLAASYVLFMQAAFQLWAGPTSTLRLRYPLFQGLVTIPASVGRWVTHSQATAAILERILAWGPWVLITLAAAVQLAIWVDPGARMRAKLARAASQTQKDTYSQSPQNLSTKAQDQPSATATAQPPPAKVQSHDTPSAVQSLDVPSAVQSHDAPSEVQSHDLASEVQSHDMPSVPAVVSEQAEAADEDEQEVAAVEASRNGRFDFYSSEDPVVLFVQAGVLANSLARHLLQHDQDQAYFFKNYAKLITKAKQIPSNTGHENKLLKLTQDMCALGLAIVGHLGKGLSSCDKNELLARHAEVADSLLGRHKAVIAAPESADEAFFLASNRQSIARLGRQLALLQVSDPDGEMAGHQELPVQHDPDFLEESMLHSEPFGKDIGMAGPMEQPTWRGPDVLDKMAIPHSEPFGKDIGMSGLNTLPTWRDPDSLKKPLQQFPAPDTALELSWHEMLPEWQFPGLVEDALQAEDDAFDCHTRLTKLREQLADLLDKTPGLRYAALDEAQVADVVRFSESLAEVSWHAVWDLKPGPAGRFDKAKAKLAEARSQVEDLEEQLTLRQESVDFEKAAVIETEKAKKRWQDEALKLHAILKDKPPGTALEAAQAKDAHEQTLEQLKVVKAELVRTQSQLKEKASGTALIAAQAKDEHKQTLEQLKVVKAELARTQSQLKEKPSGTALRAAQAKQKQTLEQLKATEAKLARTQTQLKDKPSGTALKAAQAKQKQTLEQLVAVQAELARTQVQLEEKEAALKAANKILHMVPMLMTSDGRVRTKLLNMPLHQLEKWLSEQDPALCLASALQASKASIKPQDDSPVKEGSPASEASSKSQDDWSVVEKLNDVKAGSKIQGEAAVNKGSTANQAGSKIQMKAPVNKGSTSTRAGSKSQDDGFMVQGLGAVKAGGKKEGAEPMKLAQDEWGRDLQSTLDMVPHAVKPNQSSSLDATPKDTAQNPSVTTTSAQNSVSDSPRSVAGAAAPTGTAAFAVSKAAPTPAPTATGNSSSAPSATTDTAAIAVLAAAGDSGESAAPEAAQAATHRAASPAAVVAAPDVSVKAASAPASGSFTGTVADRAAAAAAIMEAEESANAASAPISVAFTGTVADRAAAAAAMMEADESAKAFPAAAFVAADAAAGKDDSFDVEVTVELPDDKTDLHQDTGRVRVTVNTPDDSRQSLPISVVITGSDDDADDSKSSSAAKFDWDFGYDSD